MWGKIGRLSGTIGALTPQQNEDDEIDPSTMSPPKQTIASLYKTKSHVLPAQNAQMGIGLQESGTVTAASQQQITDLMKTMSQILANQKEQQEKQTQIEEQLTSMRTDIFKEIGSLREELAATRKKDGDGN